MIHPHHPGIALDRIAQRHIQIARESGIDGGFGHRHLLHRVEAFLGKHFANLLPATGDGNGGARGFIVRTPHLVQRIERKAVAADLDAVAQLHADVLLRFVALDQGHANDEHRDAKVREQHAVVAAGQRPQLRADTEPAGGAQLRDALFEVDKRGAKNPQGHEQTEGDHGCPFSKRNRQQQRADQRHGECPFEARRHFRQLRLLPLRDRTQAHQENGGSHERHEYRIEVRRTDRYFSQPQRIQKQRIEGAEHDRTRGHQQQHVVRQQRRFTGNQFKFSAKADARRAPGKQRQRGADDNDQERQDKYAARRVGRKRMH